MPPATCASTSPWTGAARRVMRRAHTWDKWTGRYRVEGKDKEGRDVVVAMNLNTKEGRGDGRPAPRRPARS